MKLFFGEPVFLWMLLPLSVLWAALAWTREGGSLRVALRFFLVMVAALALARPRLERIAQKPSRSADTVILIRDMSESAAAGCEAKVQEFVEQARAAGSPPRFEFASHPGPLWESVPRALSSTRGGRSVRIVLFTDGRFPPSEREGLLEVARRIGAPIDVIPVWPGDAGPKVAIETMILKNNVLKVGETLVADVHVWSPGASGDTQQPVRRQPALAIDADGKRIQTLELGPEAGPQSFRACHRVTEEGLHRLTASISGGNSITHTFRVARKSPLLLVTHDPQDAAHLVAALQTGGFEVAVVSPAEFPENPDLLDGYVAVILYDMPPLLSDPQDRSLEHYVRETGGGVLFIGGPAAFSLGAFAGTRLGSLLPVSPDIPKDVERYRVALGLVLDTSGSMAEEAGGRRKVDLVAEAARQAVEILKLEVDEAGVLVFAGEPRWIVPLQALQSVDSVQKRLGELQPGGETELLPALTQMRLAMEESTARIRHVLVLSDGRTAGDPQNFYDLAEQMASAGITLSAVAVGHAAQEDLLQGIAEQGGGGFYLARSPEELPQIFTQDTRRHTRSGLVEEPAVPRLKEDDAWRGTLAIETIPPLLGHVASRVRPGCHLALETDGGLPLLAWSQRGLGRVAFFASDASGRWGRLWIDRWNGFDAFWCQVVRFTARSQPPPLKIEYVESPVVSGLRLRFDSRAEVLQGPWQLQCLDASGQILAQAEGIPLSAEALWISLPERLPPGPCEIRLKGPSQELEALFDIDPPDNEWLHLIPDTAFLQEVAYLSGGRYAPRPGEWPAGANRPSSFSLVSPMLCLAALLLLFEAASQISLPVAHAPGSVLEGRAPRAQSPERE